MALLKFGEGKKDSRDLSELLEDNRTPLWERRLDELEGLGNAEMTKLFARELERIYRVVAKEKNEEGLFGKEDGLVSLLRENNEILKKQQEIIQEQNKLLQKQGEALARQEEKLDAQAETLKEIQKGFREIVREHAEMVMDTLGSLAKELRAVNEEGEIDAEKIRERLATLERLREMLDNASFEFADEEIRKFRNEVVGILRKLPTKEEMVKELKEAGGAIINITTNHTGRNVQTAIDTTADWGEAIRRDIENALSRIENSFQREAGRMLRSANPYSNNVHY